MRSIDGYFKSTPFRRKRVLLVDDEREIGWILGKIICECGHKFIFAVTLQEGMQRVKEDKRIDVAIIDLRLGENSGLALIKRVKQLNDKICLIMLTAFEAGDVENKARQAGANYFLSKPLQVERLLGILNH